MLKRYEQFLKEFDKHLRELQQTQSEQVKCTKGCSRCCQQGDYPFSRLEMEYLMAGFVTLPKEIQDKVRENVKEAKGKKEYKCPFLIDDLCCLYDRRGLVCRIHGLAYLNEGAIRLPDCANYGLNYSDVYDKETKKISIENVIKENLRIDVIFDSPLAQKYNLEKGQIRRLIDWF